MDKKIRNLQTSQHINNLTKTIKMLKSKQLGFAMSRFSDTYTIDELIEIRKQGGVLTGCACIVPHVLNTMPIKKLTDIQTILQTEQDSFPIYEIVGKYLGLVAHDDYMSLMEPTFTHADYRASRGSKGYISRERAIQCLVRLKTQLRTDDENVSLIEWE